MRFSLIAMTVAFVTATAWWVSVVADETAPREPAEAAPRRGVVIDLTHPFDETTIYWPGGKPFVLERTAFGKTKMGYFYASNNFSSAEHLGTHIDAPIHFHEDRRFVDEIPVDQLIGPGVVIDVTKQCAADRDYRITVADIEAHEAAHGRIPDGAIVLLRTGFGAHWPDRQRYMGTDGTELDAVAKLHFPGLHHDAAKWLTANRKIGAVGIDTASIDYGQSKTYSSHVYLFAANVPALENVAHLDKLPPRGFTVIALPMKIKGGSGGPTRIVAMMQ